MQTEYAVVDLAPLTDRGWLAEQPPEFQAWMARNGRWVSYAPRQVLYDAGDDPDALYGLGEGALEVTLPLVADEPVTVHRAEPGSWIGESAILARTTRLLSVAAATPARVFRVPGPRILALVAERPEAWAHFYALSHINAGRAVSLLAEALALTPRARLARMLLRLADAEGRVVVRQDELALLIGMTRSSLQRGVAGMIGSGAVEPGYGCLMVRDREALEAIRDES